MKGPDSPIGGKAGRVKSLPAEPVSADTSRRGFVKACGAVAALAAASSGRLAQPAFALENAPRLKLVDKTGKPIKAGALDVHKNYVFLYPYVSTPCLLLRLEAATPRNVARKDAQGARYTWPGGVGRDGAVVAYSAICAHTLSYNSRQNSFLTYHEAPDHLSGRGHVITCCAHGSVYDPTEGSKVVGGPAKFPLAAVQLAYNADTDELTADGLVGTALIKEFFKAYRADLNAEFGRGAYRALLERQTIVLPMQEYSRNIIRC
jgi:arsenite oxidase small subunit